MKNGSPHKAKLQKERMDRWEFLLNEAEVDIHLKTKTDLRIMHNGHEVILFPFKGWFTGKSVKDGRGIEKLLKQLKQHTNA